MTNTRPFDSLNESIGSTVILRLKDGQEVRGTLKAFDVHMNIVLEEAQTLENNEPKIRYGKLIVRGDNILMISP